MSSQKKERKITMDRQKPEQWFTKITEYKFTARRLLAFEFFLQTLVNKCQNNLDSKWYVFVVEFIRVVIEFIRVVKTSQCN